MKKKEVPATALAARICLVEYDLEACCPQAQDVAALPSHTARLETPHSADCLVDLKGVAAEVDRVQLAKFPAKHEHMIKTPIDKINHDYNGSIFASSGELQTSTP